MKINKKVKIALRSLLMKCGAIATDKATLLFEGAEPEVDAEVFLRTKTAKFSLPLTASTLPRVLPTW